MGRETVNVAYDPMFHEMKHKLQKALLQYLREEVNWFPGFVRYNGDIAFAKTYPQEKGQAHDRRRRLAAATSSAASLAEEGATVSTDAASAPYHYTSYEELGSFAELAEAQAHTRTALKAQRRRLRSVVEHANEPSSSSASSSRPGNHSAVQPRHVYGSEHSAWRHAEMKEDMHRASTKDLVATVAAASSHFAAATKANSRLTATRKSM